MGAIGTYTVILGYESDFYSFIGGARANYTVIRGGSLTLTKVSQSSVYGTSTAWVQTRCLHMMNS